LDGEAMYDSSSDRCNPAPTVQHLSAAFTLNLYKNSAFHLPSIMKAHLDFDFHSLTLPNEIACSFDLF
jgi:hypothetical protein